MFNRKTPAKVHKGATSTLPSIEAAPNDKSRDVRKMEVRVQTHVLMYWAGVRKKIIKVKMIDVPLLIEGKLHFGKGPSGVPWMRWEALVEVFVDDRQAVVFAAPQIRKDPTADSRAGGFRQSRKVAIPAVPLVRGPAIRPPPITVW